MMLKVPYHRRYRHNLFDSHHGKAKRRKMRHISSFLASSCFLFFTTCCCVHFLLLVRTVYGSFSITVPPREEECFVIRAPGKEISTISGNYDMLDDGLSPNPLSVVLYDMSTPRLPRPVWKSIRGRSEGIFTYKRARGRHQLCIRNGLDKLPSDNQDRNVGFNIRVTPNTIPVPDGGGMIKETTGATLGPNATKEEKEKHERAQEEAKRAHEKTTRVLSLSRELIRKLYDMTDHQAYLRNREGQHRELTEQTFSRIVRWTVLEAVVLVLVAVGQVWYLRKFFETKRYL